MASSDDLADQIVKQVDFYFSDSNFSRDKFLQEEVKKNENGWVPLTTMLKFKRLAALSLDAAVIAEALTKSGLVEVNEDRQSIRRSPSHPLPAERAFDDRSIYAKGFPADNDNFEPVAAFFTQKGYKVLSVRMRRHPNTKAFKGSAFIEFSDAAEATKAAGETHDYNGSQLEVLLKPDYFKAKKEKYDGAKQKPKPEKRKERKSEAEDDDEEEDEAPAVSYEPGCLLSLKNIAAGTTREELKTTFAEFGEVGWVEFDRDDTEGVVRFKKAGDAVKVIEAAKTKEIKLSGAVPEMKALEGAEEKSHYARIEQEKKNRFSRGSRGGGRRGGRGGNRGGHRGKGRGGKRKQDD